MQRAIVCTKVENLFMLQASACGMYDQGLELLMCCWYALPYLVVLTIACAQGLLKHEPLALRALGMGMM